MIRTKTLKGWVNSTNYLTNQNVDGLENAKKQVEQLLAENEGYKEKPEFYTPDDYRGIDKIRVYGWYWRGNWSSPEKCLFTILYKPIKKNQHDKE